MTSPRRTGRLNGVGAWLLAVLAAVGLLVFGGGTVSAHTLPDGQTRVRASAPETITAVGVSEHVAAGQGRGPPVLQGRFVVATGVAVDTAGSIRAVNPLGGATNCVNCAIATDSTLSGAPAQALLSGPKPISALEKIYGGTFKSVSGRSDIESILSNAGPGARGIVFGSRGTQVGHVWNAVNQNGTIRFLDGQSGGVASFNGYSSFSFLRTN